MEWRSLFADRILDRGRQYQLGGKIKDFKSDAHGISASVAGTESYAVEIALQSDVITSMHCTCPYAQNGENCKHMAAVLFQYNKTVENVEEVYTEESLIAKVDALMQHYLWDDVKVPEKLEYPFSAEMRLFLRSEVMELAYNDSPLAAFHVCSYILLNVDQVIGWDQCGFVNSVMVLCSSMMKDFVNMAPPEEKSPMIEWLVTHEEAHGKRIKFEISMALRDCRYDYGNVLTQFQKKLSLLDQESVDESSVDENDFGEHHPEAVKVIGFRDKFFAQRKKKQMLRDAGDMEGYEAALRELIVHHVPRNLFYFRELKYQYLPDDWETWRNVREEIFAELEEHLSLGYLFREEQMYDRLLEWVRQSKNFFRLQEHLDKLQDLYPDEIPELYADLLIHLSGKSSGNRDEYCQWIDWAFDLRKMEGGEERLQRIIETWEGKYQRRVAMMDELEKRKERERYGR